MNLRPTDEAFDDRAAKRIDGQNPAVSAIKARIAFSLTVAEGCSQLFLFAYGTLQDPDVQMACFGRLLEGEADGVAGYTRSHIEIADPTQPGRPGVYPILDPSGDPADRVAGTLLTIHLADLAAADGYEGSEYRRIAALLLSGREAWFYVRATPNAASAGP